MNEQQQPPKQRRLKMSCAGTDKPNVHVPYLRLRGHWLKDAGFEIGRSVKIEVSAGRLTIEPVN